MIFQQDNASCHRGSRAREWFRGQEFDVMECLAQSPDPNLIETLWAITKKWLNQYSTPPSGLLELCERTETIWNGIGSETCRGLVHSMPKRIKKVLKAHSGWIRERKLFCDSPAQLSQCLDHFQTTITQPIFIAFNKYFNHICSFNLLTKCVFNIITSFIIHWVIGKNMLNLKTLGQFCRSLYLLVRQ